MKPFERQQHIFNYLMTNGKTKVDELASHFHLTGATIRKDLTALEKQNKVLRTYGSVVVTQKDLEQDPPIDFKTNVNLSQKQRIGKKPPPSSTKEILLSLMPAVLSYKLSPI